MRPRQAPSPPRDARRHPRSRRPGSRRRRGSRSSTSAPGTTSAPAASQALRSAGTIAAGPPRPRAARARPAKADGPSPGSSSRHSRPCSHSASRPSERIRSKRRRSSPASSRVESDVERAASKERGPLGRVRELRRELRPHRMRGQRGVEQILLAPGRLADRRQHPRRDARGARAAARRARGRAPEAPPGPRAMRRRGRSRRRRRSPRRGARRCFVRPDLRQEPDPSLAPALPGSGSYGRRPSRPLSPGWGSRHANRSPRARCPQHADSARSGQLARDTERRDRRPRDTSRLARLHAARLYFVCDAPARRRRSRAPPRCRPPRRRRRDPASREGAALRRGARSRWPSRFAAPPTPRRALLLQRPPRAGRGVRRRRRSRRPGRHAGRRSPRAGGRGALVGLSTHSPEQFDAALAATGDARPDQLSAGPVWETPTKEGRPAAGLELIRHASGRAPAMPHGSRSAASTSRMSARWSPRARAGSSSSARSATQAIPRPRLASCVQGLTLMGSRERKRAERRKRKERSGDRSAELAAQREARAARTEAKNQAAREALEPLEPDERPGDRHGRSRDLGRAHIGDAHRLRARRRGGEGGRVRDEDRRDQGEHRSHGRSSP